MDYVESSISGESALFRDESWHKIFESGANFVSDVSSFRRLAKAQPRPTVPIQLMMCEIEGIDRSCLDR